jgi:hypothetical protein
MARYGERLVLFGNGGRSAIKDAGRHVADLDRRLNHARQDDSVLSH